MSDVVAPLRRVRALLDSRYVFLIAIVLGVLLSLPTLSTGLSLDDYPQRIALLTGLDQNVFDFIHPGSAATEARVESGLLPWWTHPETKISFYRPVAQWFMELDYRLWPDDFVLMHLHSVLWYAMLVLVAGAAYRSLMPTRWGAGLAAILFAIDAPHRGAIAWLASRNTLLCATAALMCLLCYRQRRWIWQIPGCLLFALALGCNEGALAITGYLFAYEIFLSERRWHERLLRLLPYAIVALAALAFWKSGGYGVAGPNYYIDPLAEPGPFLSALIYRFPAYLVGQFLLLFPPVEIFSRFEDSGLRPYVLAYALAVLTLLVWLLMPLLRSSRLARFFGLGMLIAVIPICGSTLYSRALWFVGFGATGLLALFVEQYRDLPMAKQRLKLSALFAGAMIVVHLWTSPLVFVGFGMRAQALLDRLDSRRVQLPDQGALGRKVLVLSTANYGATITFPWLKDQALSLGNAPTRPPPSIVRVRALTEGTGTFELLRKDADTLQVRTASGLNTLRPSRYGFLPGDRVNLDDVQIQVQAVSSQRAPTQIEYRFSPGTLAAYQVIAWQGKRFVPFQLPAIGQSVTINPGAAVPAG